MHTLAEPYDDTGYKYGQVSPVRQCAIEEMELGRATDLLKRCGYRDSVDVAEAQLSVRVASVHSTASIPLPFCREMNSICAWFRFIH